MRFEKGESGKKNYLICVVIIIIMWKNYGFLGWLTCRFFHKKRLFGFSSLRFIETCSKYQFCNFL